MAFKPATREKAKLKMAIIGGPKDGKSFTSLRLMRALVGPEGKIAAIDTENGSLSKYAGANGFAFDVEDLNNHNPKQFIDRVYEAVKEGYDGIIIDSMSHEWMGNNGCLEMKEEIAKKDKSKDNFSGWADVTPVHNEVFRVLNAAPIHVICTFRVKTEYVMEEYVKANGMKGTRPRKVGLAPVTRDGSEYEFDIVMTMEEGVGRVGHTTRCPLVRDAEVKYPGEELAATIKQWLEEGAPVSAPAEQIKVPKSSESKPVAATAANTQAIKTANASATNTSKVEQAASPKSAGDTVATETGANAAPGAGETLPASTTPAPAPSPAKVGAEQMQQLLKAGTDNGWSRPQISEFVCFAYKLTPQTLVTNITWKQWETTVKLVGRPENAGGKVIVSADGKPLEEKHRWPTAQQVA